MLRCRRDVEVEWDESSVRDDGEGNRLGRDLFVQMCICSSRTGKKEGIYFRKEEGIYSRFV